MALFDRVKERTETDVSDTELQAMIDEASGEIVRRYGAAGEVTVVVEGCAKSIFPHRPVDGAEDITIEETVYTTVTELEDDDYRIWHGGRRLERVATGTNPRSVWGNPVEITYTPVDDSNQRAEVVIKLVMLSIEYDGVRSGRVGDTSEEHVNYQREREDILSSLAPAIKLA